jgi:uncharacterized protein
MHSRWGRTTGWHRVWLGLWVGLGAVGAWANAEDDAQAREQHLADALRRPAWGLYQGYALYKMARYEEARSLWLALARNGTAEAWFHLGTLAEDGRGEPQDRREALQRYEQAAQGGSTKAMHRLAVVLLDGTLGTVEPTQALHWLDRLAREGDVEAGIRATALRQRGDIEGQCHGNR